MYPTQKTILALPFPSPETPSREARRLKELGEEEEQAAQLRRYYEVGPRGRGTERSEICPVPTPLDLNATSMSRVIIIRAVAIRQCK